MAGDEDRSVRICTRVADNPLQILTIPTAVKDVCHECNEPIWVDSAQKMPDIVTKRVVEVWCMQCAIADETLGPTIAVNLQAAADARDLGLPAHSWVAPSRKRD